MEAMEYKKWLINSHKAIVTVGNNCFRNGAIAGWEENHITAQLLNAIGATGQLAWDEYPQRVVWSAHKLVGRAEMSFGDVALVVKVHLAPGHVLDGVAFYEAKKQYFNRSYEQEGYSALKAGQLSTLSEHTHASHVLLYDMLPNSPGGHYAFRASAVPTEFVRELNASGRFYLRNLYQLGHLWIEALGRNLRGFDLDFRPDAVDSIRAAIERAEIPFVLNAGVAMEPSLELSLQDVYLNVEGYERLSSAIGHEPDPQRFRGRSGGGHEL